MEGFFQQYLRLYRPILNTVNDILSEYDLSYSLWQVIYCVKHYGPTTLVDIAKRYNVEKPTITRRVNFLEKNGIIKKAASHDRREKIIHLTPKGEDLYKTCREKITSFELTLTDELSHEEQEQFFKILSKLQKHLQKKGN